MIHFTNVFALWTCIVHLVSLSEQTIAFKSILLADAGVVAIRASMLKMFRFCICILLVVLFLSRTLETTFYVNLIYQSIYSSVERKQFDYIETCNWMTTMPPLSIKKVTMKFAPSLLAILPSNGQKLWLHFPSIEQTHSYKSFCIYNKFIVIRWMQNNSVNEFQISNYQAII